MTLRSFLANSGFSSLSQLFRSRRKKNSARRPSRKFLRLGLEQLEGRALLAGIANDDYVSVLHGKTIDYTTSTQPGLVLTANDTANGGLGSDGVNGAHHLSLDSVVAGPNYGNLTRVGTYSGITYVSDKAFVGTDTFDYAYTDKNGNWGSATVFIDVYDNAPIAVNDTYSIGHDRTLTVANTNGVLKNDSDFDGDSLTAALVPGAGPTHGVLVPATNGASLTTAGAFKYTPNPGFAGIDQFTYEVSDGALTRQATVTINVTNVAPSALTLSNSQINENLIAATVVGNLSATDPDVSEVLTYSLAAGFGDTDNAMFTLTDNHLKTAAKCDFEAKNSYAVRLQVKDAVGATFEAPFTISVLNVNEKATAIQLSNASVDENMPDGTVVGTLTVTDQDIGDVQTLSLVAGTGDADNALFEINGPQLKTLQTWDFEQIPKKTTFNVRVRTTDAGGLFFDKAFAISLNNVNEPPQFTDQDPLQNGIQKDVATTLAPDQKSATNVLKMSANDPDANDKLTYSIGAASNPDGLFAINASTGQITLAKGLGFASQSLYVLNVAVSDSLGLTDQANVTVNIPAPSVSFSSTGYSATVQEGASSASTAAKLTVQLSSPRNFPITVQYDTSDNTATTADNDYTGVVGGSVTFSPGDATKQITLNVIGDNKAELSEYFTGNRSRPGVTFL